MFNVYKFYENLDKETKEGLIAIILNMPKDDIPLDQESLRKTLEGKSKEELREALVQLIDTMSDQDIDNSENKNVR